jgi:methylenetetrahydrofolate dehydrogenase (NADP+) / methenyltetrahydrofolate cyclohydrolase
MKIFDGRKEKEIILLDLKRKISLVSVKPCLAVLLIGNNKTSELYVNLKKKAGRLAGIKVLEYRFKGNVSQTEIIKKIEKLNENKKINGIIIQLPLPRKFNTEKIIETISPKKDVDGFRKNSLFSPVLPSAILFALNKSGQVKRNKKIIVIANSNIFADKLKEILFKKLKIKAKIILGIKSKKIFELKNILKKADIIITVCGIPELIKGDMIKKGVVIIDGGIIRLTGKKIVGDVNKKSIENKVFFLTPVPGGIGPITVALLLKNTYLSFEKYGKK